MSCRQLGSIVIKAYFVAAVNPFTLGVPRKVRTINNPDRVDQAVCHLAHFLPCNLASRILGSPYLLKCLNIRVSQSYRAKVTVISIGHGVHILVSIPIPLSSPRDRNTGLYSPVFLSLQLGPGHSYTTGRLPVRSNRRLPKPNTYNYYISMKHNMSTPGGLPSEVLNHLTTQRGIDADVIAHHKLGWNGKGITIPITNQQNQSRFLKVAPWSSDAKPQPTECLPFCEAELYGWEHLKEPLPSSIVICDGELNRLALESHGIRAVTGTAGPNVFLRKWVVALSKINHIFICYNPSSASQRGIEQVLELLPEARVIQLPAELGPKGDVTDFFGRLRKDAADFAALLSKAQALPADAGGGECPTGSRKSAATVNTSYPTFCISAMLSSSRSRCAFSIQRCS